MNNTILMLWSGGNGTSNLIKLNVLSLATDVRSAQSVLRDVTLLKTAMKLYCCCLNVWH